MNGNRGHPGLEYARRRGEILLKWMRQRAHYRRVPFIMISGENHYDDIIEAFMKLGVDAYVVKPFQHEEKIMLAIDKRARI